MGHVLEKIAINLLGFAGVYPTYATDKGRVQELIRTLRPVTTDKGLIRLGPSGDGGYLVPNDLSGVEACFSPGVADCSDFEKACAELGMSVFLADRSVDAPAAMHPKSQFIKKSTLAPRLMTGSSPSMTGWSPRFPDRSPN